MTSIGTSIAAAVAQTGLQAQQLARQRDRAHAQSAREAQRLHELLQAHFEALEEGDEIQASDQLRIDSNVQQHQSPPQDQQEKKPHTPPSAEPEAQASAASPPPASAEALYRHVDIQA